MEADSAKYHFRRRDYAKIKSWYDFAKQQYVPEDFQNNINQQFESQQSKKGEWHYRLIFRWLNLTELYVNQNIKRLMNLKQLIFLPSLYHKKRQCILTNGRQFQAECDFDISTLTLTLKEEILLYFYIEDKNSDYHQLCLEIQGIDNDGYLFKVGACRYDLVVRKDGSKINSMVIFNHLFTNRQHQKEIQALSQSNIKPKALGKGQKANPLQSLENFVGKIEIELDLEAVKEIKRYLPPFKIIDKNSKIAPTSFNLKNKKEQLIVDAHYGLTLRDMLLRIDNVNTFKTQIISNNPFTLSHKELVEYDIKEFRVVIDNHNGWKFFRQGRNEINLELVVEKGQQIYLSSNKIKNISINYYESQLLVLVVLLICKVQFKLKGMIDEKRCCDFVVGWLPLPLDLSLRQNKVDLIMVNDMIFPTSTYSLLGVQSTIDATFVHPNFSKYKSKHDQKNFFAEQLLQDNMNVSVSEKYMRLRSKRMITESFSSEFQIQQESQVDARINNIKIKIKQNEQKIRSDRCIRVTGKANQGQLHMEHTSLLPLESTVGKMLRVRLEINTIIPQTDCSSSYELPRKLKGTVYFLRQTSNLPVHICQSQGSFHVPLRINAHKETFTFEIMVNSVQEFQNIMSSRLIVTLYEQDEERLFAKGATSSHNILGAVEGDRCSFVQLFRWQDSSYKVFGTLLVKVALEVLKPRSGRSKVEEVDINKVVNRLPASERMKMKIGLFKGNQQLKTEAVNIIKKRKQNEYISKIVEDQLHRDGQIQYEIGVDSYHLINFQNEDKSQNNVFTFHLGCVYAQIVTDQQEYLSVIERLNLEKINYQKMDYVLRDPLYFSYYETKLRYNQQIGVLIKLNVSEYSDKQELLSKLEIIVKRNTLDNKRINLKCIHKPSFVYDVVYDYGILQKNQDLNKDIVVPINQEILANYKDVLVLNKNVIWHHKTKQIQINQPERTKRIMLLAQPLNEKQRKIIFYELLLLHGKILNLTAGQPHRLNIELQSTIPAQILRSYSNEIDLLNTVKFAQLQYNESKDLTLTPLKEYQTKNYIVNCFDLTGQRLSQYLLQVRSQLQFISSQMEIMYDQSGTYSVLLENPYPCYGIFKITSSNRAIIFQERQIRLEGYGNRIVMFGVGNLKWDEPLIYVYLLDSSDNVCQVVQVNCRVPQIPLKEQMFI